MTGRADYLEPGSWNAVCWQCGRKRKSSQLVKNWQGYWVCPEHNEPRHPQEFVRAPETEKPPPWTQPMPADTLVYVCDLAAQSSVANQAAADCATADQDIVGA